MSKLEFPEVFTIKYDLDPTPKKMTYCPKHNGWVMEGDKSMYRFSATNIEDNIDNGWWTIVEDKPVFKKGDKVVVRSSQLPSYWYADKIGEIYTLNNSHNYMGWGVVGEDGNYLVEEDIELYVEEPEKYDDFEDALKYGFMVLGAHVQVENCTFESKDVNNIKETAKELLSVQEYLRQIGVAGLDVVISASQMLVVDADGKCYECDDVSHVYSVIDSIALLVKARK